MIAAAELWELLLISGTSSSNKESVPEGAPASDAQEDDSAMLFYHESHQSASNGSDALLEKAVIKHKGDSTACPVHWTSILNGRDCLSASVKS